MQDDVESWKGSEVPKTDALNHLYERISNDFIYNASEYQPGFVPAAAPPWPNTTGMSEHPTSACINRTVSVPPGGVDIGLGVGGNRSYSMGPEYFRDLASRGSSQSNHLFRSASDVSRRGVDEFQLGNPSPIGHFSETSNLQNFSGVNQFSEAKFPRRNKFNEINDFHEINNFSVGNNLHDASNYAVHGKFTKYCSPENDNADYYAGQDAYYAEVTPTNLLSSHRHDPDCTPNEESVPFSFYSTECDRLMHQGGKGGGDSLATKLSNFTASLGSLFYNDPTHTDSGFLLSNHAVESTKDGFIPSSPVPQLSAGRQSKTVHNGDEQKSSVPTPLIAVSSKVTAAVSQKQPLQQKPSYSDVLSKHAAGEAARVSCAQQNSRRLVDASNRLVLNSVRVTAASSSHGKPRRSSTGGSMSGNSRGKDFSRGVLDELDPTIAKEGQATNLRTFPTNQPYWYEDEPVIRAVYTAAVSAVGTTGTAVHPSNRNCIKSKSDIKKCQTTEKIVSQKENDVYRGSDQLNNRLLPGMQKQPPRKTCYINNNLNESIARPVTSANTFSDSSSSSSGSGTDGGHLVKKNYIKERKSDGIEEVNQISSVKATVKGVRSTARAERSSRETPVSGKQRQGNRRRREESLQSLFQSGNRERRLSQGLEANITLPMTGEEAMKRLLACKGKDPYGILGVTRDCSDEDIKRHYKRQAFLVHPDKNKGPGAEEAFKILAHAFEVIGEPERRQVYDTRLAEEVQLGGAWGELAALLARLKEKLDEAANTIRCTNCNRRHRRTRLPDRPVYAARHCVDCQIHHSAREGDIWAESTVFGLRWRYYACMEGAVFDITEWASCQRENLKHLQANTHAVQYRIVSGKKNGSGKPAAPEFPSDPDLEEFFNNLCKERFGGAGSSTSSPQPPSGQPTTADARKRAAKGKKKK